MLSEQQKNDLEYWNSVFIKETDDIAAMAEKVKPKLLPEVLVSVIHMRTFAAYIKSVKIETIDQMWALIKEGSSMVEKSSYVKHYLLRLQDAAAQKA